MNLALLEDPRTSKSVQLMENTRKLWTSAKYHEKAPIAKQKLPKAVKAIIATDGGPTGR